MTVEQPNGTGGDGLCEDIVTGDFVVEENGKDQSPRLCGSLDEEVGTFIDGERCGSKKRRRPRRTLCQLLLNGSQQFAIEFAFGCETALGSPLLLELGVPLYLYGICWLLGPILGSTLGPVLGSFSDNCTSQWGRRRPFLVVLNILTLLGSACYLNVENIDNEEWALTAAMVGIFLVDLCAFLTESLSRAYLLDVSEFSDTSRGLFIRSIIGGIGCGTAYLVNGINWKQTWLGTIFGNNYEVIFVFNVLIYIVCVPLTLVSIPEESLAEGGGEKDKGDLEEIPLLPNDANSNGVRHHYGRSTDGHDASCSYTETTELVSAESCDSLESAPSIGDRIKSVLRMPRALVWLCVTHFFGFSSFCVILLYFTDYFAQAVVGGNPDAPLNTTAFEAYEAGTRLGSWGLCIFGYSSALLSVCFIKITQYVSLKAVYVTCPLIYAVCVGSLALLTDYPLVTLALCSTFALLFSTIQTVPYDILAIYHRSKEFTHPENGLVRGQGTDMAMLFAMAFIAQIFAAITIGPLVTVTGSELTVVISSSGLALMSVICAAFLVSYEV
ncbi:membrane-associated transporter protein-like [Diadema antillarum]|uniref:membrane-associated transporter protein-like n=1 Tax=Diadema antillarum TaxID=105358 RepID=UPI003A89D143